MDRFDRLGIKLFWPKTKDEVLVETLGLLDKYGTKKGIFRRLPVWSYAAAMLIPVLLTCHFYTVTKQTSKGEHAVVGLPCRSTVTLNADSKITYKPLNWFISRNVRIEGEGCFEVKSGSRFTVQSGSNRVKVLGTAFNVYSRLGVYRITCISGAVQVNTTRESVILNPNMQATILESQLNINRNMEPSVVTGWIRGKFVFDKTPLKEVITEVERQYNINVVPKSYPNPLYSGNFSKTGKPEEILEAIGKPFNIKFGIE